MEILKEREKETNSRGRENKESKKNDIEKKDEQIIIERQMRAVRR